MKRALYMMVLAAGCFLPLPLHADPYYRPPSPPPPGPSEAIGCYWMSGERYCARYCYWEVNGKRYCREQQDLAVPQGPLPEVIPESEQPKVLYKSYK